VRVDAQVVWRARRDRATLVPATDRVVTLAAVAAPTADGHAPLPLVITDRMKVAQLAHLFDALPVSIPGEHGCPLETDDGYLVTFRPTRTASPDVVATLQCNGVDATVNGHHVELDDHGFKDAVFARIGR
jgi:hypothetical protein